MTATKLEIKTDDGVCPTTMYGDPSKPNVLMYMDGIGMRPALHAMAERLANAGFYVMLPDLFYRIGPYTAPEPVKLFTDPDVRASWWKMLHEVATSANLMRDTRALLEHLPAAKIGTTGYCMGGRLSLIAAGTFPDRIAAAAAFHPGNLANDAPDSPHLLAKSIKARVFIAAASDDSSFPPEQVTKVEESLTAAHVDYKLEVWPVKHGWVPTDTPVHDAAHADKHFEALTALLRGALT